MTSPNHPRLIGLRRTRAEIDAQPHIHRARAPELVDPDRVLAQLPLGHRDWKRILVCILAKHGHQHGTKVKGVSNRLLYERHRFLFQFFHLLHTETIYKRVEPRCLGNRHVAAAVALWAARGLSSGTIANYLSMLRVFATWVGKDRAIVRPAAAYLGNGSPLAHRNQVAEYDHSWVAAGVDSATMVARIRELCPYVSIQTEFSRLFGLRPREARCLRPHEAVRSLELVAARDVDPALPATHYLFLAQGTKGDRPRAVPILSDEQWDLIHRAQTLVPRRHHLGRPGYTLKQNTSHYYRVLAQVGIVHRDLGVTAHGLRHGYALDEYAARAGASSPLRGGAAKDRSTDRTARTKVARLLGHNRPGVTSAYLGKSVVMRSGASESTTTRPEEESSNST